MIQDYKRFEIEMQLQWIMIDKIITHEEYESLKKLITSPDNENIVVAIEIMKNKINNWKKNGKPRDNTKAHS